MFSFYLKKIGVLLLAIILPFIVLCTPVRAQPSSTFTEFTIPTNNGRPYSILLGQDGNLWFTERFGGNIGKITPNGDIHEYEVGGGELGSLALGFDSNLWFTQTGKIRRMTLNGFTSDYPLPNPDSDPSAIVAGSDGNMWFTNYFSNKIGKITPNGIVTEYSISTDTNTLLGLGDLTLGSDGNIWFGENYNIGKITPNGDITHYPLSSSSGPPRGMTTGPDGNIWFTEGAFSKIGRMTPNGKLTEFRVSLDDSGLTDIISGPDNSLWFIEKRKNKIAKITLDGIITEYEVNTTSDGLISLAFGSDGNIWYTDWLGNKIVKMNIANLPTPIPSSPLNVPYFSQNALPWGPSEYDHTKLLGVTGNNATMDRWGCAVTSITMILNYHNIKQFENGTPITPGSLNDWLKDPKNKGYSYGYGKDGWYSYINWNTISTLTQQLYNVGKAPYKLEWQRKYPSAATTSLINADLKTGNSLAKIPEVLFVNNNGHFVVAKGIEGSTYAINDPEWNYTTLSAFNNTYSQVDRYVPSQTDLSYITAIVNPDVELLITDSQGRKTGKVVQAGQTVTYDEIPDASYGFEAPISNLTEQGIQEKLGTGVNTLLLPKPENGGYSLTVSSNTQTHYTLNVSTFETDGDNALKTINGAITPTTNNIVTFAYSQSVPTEIKKEISFTVLKSDLNALYTQKQIKNKGVYTALKLQIELSEKASTLNKQPLGNKLAVLALKTFLFELKAGEKGKYITEDAYQILYNDTDLLIKKLQNTSEVSPTPTPDSGS